MHWNTLTPVSDTGTHVNRTDTTVHNPPGFKQGGLQLLGGGQAVGAGQKDVLFPLSPYKERKVCITRQYTPTNTFTNTPFAPRTR